MNIFLTINLFLIIVLLCTIVIKSTDILITLRNIFHNQACLDNQLDDIKDLSERTLNKATVNGYAIAGETSDILGRLKKIENYFKEYQVKSNPKPDLSYKGTPYHVRMLEIFGSERERFLTENKQ